MKTKRSLYLQNDIKAEGTNLQDSYFSISRLITKARYSGVSCSPNT